ncbi:MAG TPA: FAD-binding oxidoreductase [Candidatus Limnocylindrales bacterium]|nr:FAD-binding oxidoreductase [Candidatus Limnocylindrales bacterium]
MVTSDYLRDARVAIVGAGAIGASLAYRLAQAGAAVTVVERAWPGAGTTGRTFGWINGVDKPPRDYHRLNVLGIRDHEDLADELGGDWVHVTGSLHWAPDADGSHRSGLEASVRQMIGWGMRVDRLTAEQAVHELEPDLRIDPGAVSAVYLVHRSGWMDPMAMAHAALRAAVERYGATLVEGEVAALPVSGGMIDRLVLADGTTIEADVVVNAAGPDAARLAALAGVTLPVERTPGLLLVTEPVAARLRHVVYAPDIHLRPDGGGRVMVQWDPLDNEAADERTLPPDDPHVVTAMGHAAAALPALARASVLEVRLGVRPVPRDGYPLVGFDPAVGNLYHVVTHSGITLAARLATLVTEELTGGDTAPLEAYRPVRLGARAIS